MSVRTSSRWALIGVGLIFGVLLGAAGCTGDDPASKPNYQLVGRLSYEEDGGCGAPVGSQSVSWADCHAFKRRFDPRSGDPLLTNDFVKGALRPIAGAVVLSTFEKNDETGKLTACDRVTIQTDPDGVFNTELRRCSDSQSAVVVGEVMLQYQLPGGTVRALWPEERALDLFDGFGAEIGQTHMFTTSGGARYAVPRLLFVMNIEGTTEDVVNAGNQLFLSGEGADEFDYMHQLLSAYGTAIELQLRGRDRVSDKDGYDANMFVIDSRMPSWGKSYTLTFDADWAYGGHGGMSLYRPDEELFEKDANGDGLADGSAAVEWVLSNTATIAHEYGHTMHAGLAGNSFVSDYDFATPMQRPNGEVYDWGHGYGQYQEMGTAFTEGFASTLGQYLINGCNGFTAAYRPLGGSDPFLYNMWNAKFSCDLSDGCSSHHVRYQLMRRGVVEGSDAWNTRVSRLQALTTRATTALHRFVTSNNEGRYAEFGCDLLDSDPNVGQAQLKVAGRSYLSDFTFHVGEILDGVDSQPEILTYATDVASENVQINLDQLLAGMAGFCPDCGTTPTTYGASYNDRRLSIAGSLSPQRFGRYLVEQQLVPESAMQNILKSNFMEERF